jgi:hypothetical protein
MTKTMFDIPHICVFPMLCEWFSDSIGLLTHPLAHSPTHSLTQSFLPSFLLSYPLVCFTPLLHSTTAAFSSSSSPSSSFSSTPSSSNSSRPLVHCRRYILPPLYLLVCIASTTFHIVANAPPSAPSYFVSPTPFLYGSPS